ITPPVAVRATQIDIREELHLDMLETIAGAGRTPAVAGIETEGAGGVLALLRSRLTGKDRANGIERAYITCRIRAGGTADGALIDHHDVINQLRAAQAGEIARRLGGLASVFQQGRVQHIFDER